MADHPSSHRQRGLQRLSGPQATRGEIKRFKQLKDAEEILEGSGGLGRGTARREVERLKKSLKRQQSVSDTRRFAGQDLQPPRRRR